MKNLSIAELERIKAKLFKEACDVRNKLQEREVNGCQQLTTSISVPPVEDSNEAEKNGPSERYKRKLYEVSERISGITFTDVDKNWLHDSIYKYFARVQLKIINFQLELTVNVKDEHNLEILDITCHFRGLDECYMAEIAPWVQSITRTKNFSLLMTAMSDYNTNCVLRSKILHNLEAEDYVKVYYCTEDGGGIMIDVYSTSDNPDTILKMKWTLQFTEQTCGVEHFFEINATDNRIEFAEKNRNLLKSFCEMGLKKNDLKRLWSKLCDAINDYGEE